MTLSNYIEISSYTKNIKKCLKNVEKKIILPFFLYSFFRKEVMFQCLLRSNSLSRIIDEHLLN